jgi:HlyD family secretion protein
MRNDELARLRLDPEERQAAGGRRTMLGFAAAAVIVAAVMVAVLLQRHAAAGRAVGSPVGVDTSVPAVGQGPAAGANVIAAGGYVEARRRASLYPGRDGIVAHVYATLGQRVRAGTLLLELDTVLATAQAEASRADAEAARADLEDARRSLERTEALSTSGSVTQDEVDKARYRVQSLAAQVDAFHARQRLAEGQLALSYLRAPFDGVIVRVDLEPGEVVSLFGVQSGVGAIEIADLSQIWVRIDVPEDRIGSVTLGAPAEVSVDALGPEALKAAVVEIAPVADRQSNTVKVAVRVLDPPPVLRPDMSARVTIHPKGEPE